MKMLKRMIIVLSCAVLASGCGGEERQATRYMNEANSAITAANASLRRIETANERMLRLPKDMASFKRGKGMAAAAALEAHGSRESASRAARAIKSASALDLPADMDRYIREKDSACRSLIKGLALSEQYFDALVLTFGKGMTATDSAHLAGDLKRVAELARQSTQALQDASKGDTAAEKYLAKIRPGS